MAIFLDILLDTVIDALKMLPFLFVAFLLIELLEHYSESWVNKMMTRLRKVGPIFGGLFGCIPQCGFSILSANLYTGGIITLGTLLAVFLSTSDEAILIMLGHPGNIATVGKLLIVKLIIAIVFGFIADLLISRIWKFKKHTEDDICDDCGCHDKPGILRPAIKHTIKLFVFLFVISLGLNIITELIGLDKLSAFLLGGNIFQPFLTAIIGFIPNCAASVLITELYLNGVLSFASAVAGLCTNAGLGLVVLFKMNKNRKECFVIAALLYAIAVISGLILSVLNI